MGPGNPVKNSGKVVPLHAVYPVAINVGSCQSRQHSERLISELHFGTLLCTLVVPADFLASPMVLIELLWPRCGAIFLFSSSSSERLSPFKRTGVISK
jgi:hypothetical protein